MQRLYYPKEHILGDSISINTAEQVHYLYGVLRLRPKESLLVFDGKGAEYLCVAENLTSRQIDLKVKEKRQARPIEPRLSIACAIPKKSKMDDIIDKLTQLGAASIIPMLTQRVNVEWGQQQRNKHAARWRKIAISACEQSGRAYLPVIEDIVEFKTVIAKKGDFDLKLIPNLTHKKNTLKELFIAHHFRNILVLIGPEGDFTPEEVKLALDNGFQAVSLGDLVLRVETAAVAVASYIRLDNEKNS